MKSRSSAVRERVRAWLVPVLVAGASVAAFLPALSAGFVNWDDLELLVDNPSYRGLGPANLRWMLTSLLAGHYQPVVWLSFGLDHALWAMEPMGYHLTNVLLHAANAALFFLIARRLLAHAWPGRSAGIAFAGEACDRSSPPTRTADRSSPPTRTSARALGGGEAAASLALDLSAAFAALVFAVHPLRVESVAWVTERKDVLSAFFYLVTTRCWLKAVERPFVRRGWYAAALGCYALALLSKSMTVTLPAALLLLDVYPLRRLSADPRQWVRPAWRERVFEKLPFFLLAAVTGIGNYVGMTWIEPIRPIVSPGLADRLAVAAYGLVFYPLKTLWPADLIPVREIPYPLEPLRPVFLASAAVVLAAVGGLRRWGGRSPGLSAAAAFYALSVLPVLGLIPIGGQLALDRYSYIPCMGWAMLAGAGLRGLLSKPGRRLPSLLAAFSIVAVLGVLSREQAKIWKDPFTLWGRVLAVAPESPFAHNNLAATLRREDRFEEAAVHFREALRLCPVNRDYRRRLTMTLFDLGNALLESGRAREAVPVYGEAAALACGPAELYLNLGLALARTGRVREASREYARALRVDPDSALAEYNWANALADEGRLAEAQRRYERALRLSPALVEARFNLGNALARQGRFDEAMAHYRAVQRIKPGQPGLGDNMEAVRLLRGWRPRVLP